MRALDYIQDKNDNFWIIKKVDKNKYYGQMVFKVCKKGRYNNITKKYYKKVIKNTEYKLILISSVKKIYYPNECYLNNKNKLTDKWNILAILLKEIGIEDKNIGIYGSYLIGFNLEHDIDYVVYGIESYKKVKKNIDYIRNKLDAVSITKDHINYQYNKYRHLYNKKNDLEQILSHNWAGLQIKKGILSTIRFIKRDKHYMHIMGKEITIKGIVSDGDGTNFLPRIGVINTQIGKINVITYFWMFNAFLSKGEKVLIKGKYNKKKKLIYLVNKTHWIKYLH